MGNLCIKKKGNYNNLTNLINQNYNGDIDYDTSIELFNIDNINSREELDSFKNEIIKTISNLQIHIKKLNENFNKYDNNIYKINEQNNLIYKDLKSLIDNDKILNNKIKELC